MSLWGDCFWGEFAWGGAGCLESWEAGAEVNSKPYTLYLGKADTGTGSDLATDKSQEADNMDGSGASWAYYTAGNADRFAISHPRSIIAVLDGITTSHTGVIAQYDDTPAAASAFSLEVYDDTGTKTLRADINGAADANSKLVLPGLSASASRIIVCWSSRANPDPTAGAGAAVVHEIKAQNTTTGDVNKVQWTSAAQTTTTGKAFTWMAEDSVGTRKFSAALGTAVRFDAHWCTDVELREDWDTQTALPTTATTSERPPLPLDLASGAGDAGEFYGLAPQWAGAAQHSMYRRTAWPLVNRRYRSVTAYRTTSAGPTIRLAPGSTLYKLGRAHFHGPIPVHPGCDRAWVQVHAKLYVTSGASVPIGLRVYSFNKRPGDLGKLVLVNENNEPFAKSYVEMVVDRDDTGGVGSYINFTNLLKLERAGGGIREGKTYIGLAFAIDPASASGNDANARVEINALHVVQLKAEDTQGGLGGDFGLTQP